MCFRPWRNTLLPICLFVCQCYFFRCLYVSVCLSACLFVCLSVSVSLSFCVCLYFSAFACVCPSLIVCVSLARVLREHVLAKGLREVCLAQGLRERLRERVLARGPLREACASACLRENLARLLDAWDPYTCEIYDWDPYTRERYVWNPYMCEGYYWNMWTAFDVDIAQIGWPIDLSYKHSQDATNSKEIIGISLHVQQILLGSLHVQKK